MRYTAYCLVIETPFACPALLPAPPDAAPDIVVTEGLVPFNLPEFSHAGDNWQIAPGRYLFRGGARCGRFLAEGGWQVTYQRSPTAEEGMAAFYFVDRVLAALLRQRGLLVLHANAAIRPDGSAVAVSGVSGAGKSTTLAALLQAGCAMLSDDITAVTLTADNELLVLPGAPQYHLTEDSAAGLGYDLTGIPLQRWKRMKAAMPAADVLSCQPVRLAALYHLDAQPVPQLQITALNGVNKFMALQEFVYGPLLEQEHPSLFPVFSALLEQTTVYRITRPAEQWTVAEIVAEIMA